jgi:hypothetical protein
MPYAISGLGTFPLCGDYLQYLYDLKYIGVADLVNGINGFSTPVPSIRGTFSAMETEYYYTVCGASASLVITKISYQDSAIIVTVPASLSPEFCAALAAKAATITTAAPSVFKKLPCLTITAPGLGSGVFPMCNVFLNPDDSYKCFSASDSLVVSLGYGGNANIGELCPASNKIYADPWGLVTGPGLYPEVPYPSVHTLATDYWFDVDIDFYITCCSCCLAPSLLVKYEKLFVYTIPVNTAPALCTALGFPSACPSKPSARPSVKPVTTKKPSARPMKKPSSRPTIKPKKPTTKPAVKASARPSIKPKSPTRKPSTKPTRCLST